MLNLSTANREAIASAIPWPVDFIEMTVTEVPLGECSDGREGISESLCTTGTSNTWSETDSSGSIFITNHFHDITVDGVSYMAAGEFLNFSDIADNYEVKDNTLDISLSGVGSRFTAVVLGNPIEGSLVKVSRGFYLEDSGQLADGIYERWSGSVNNYSITDDYNFTDEDKITISVSCKSLLTTLISRLSGRYTSPQGFSTSTIDSSGNTVDNSDDKSMEFVPSLSTFNPSFGNEE